MMNWGSRHRRLSLPRLWANDFLHFAAASPTVGGSYSVRVKSVAAARRNCQPLIGWAAILTKAMALTAGRWPQFRQCYMPLPWPHLYEHPCCIANLVVEREWERRTGDIRRSDPSAREPLVARNRRQAARYQGSTGRNSRRLPPHHSDHRLSVAAAEASVERRAQRIGPPESTVFRHVLRQPAGRDGTCR